MNFAIAPAGIQKDHAFLARIVRWICGAAALCTTGGEAAPRFESVTLDSNGPPATVHLAWDSGRQQRHPVILMLGSLKAGELPDWSTNLVRDGWMLAAFTVEHPADPDPSRRPVWLHFDERFAHSYVLGGSRMPADTARVIDYLATRPDVNAHGIGWLGSSTTGILGLAAAVREPRIKALVAFVATGAYEEWLNTWKPNGLWRGGEAGLWAETVTLLPDADPIRWATKLFPCAVLLVNGGDDKVVDVRSTRAFVAAARPAYAADPERLRLVVYEGFGHNLPRDVVREHAEHWFRLYLNPSIPLPAPAGGPASLVGSPARTALNATPHEAVVQARPAEPAPRTSLANPAVRFTVPEKSYAVLRRGEVEVVVVDNRAVDDEVLPGHRAGYHGIGALRHARQRRNLFVPAYAGLNFEHIHDGTPQAREILFEPRHAPMQLRVVGPHTAELYQAPTPFWGLESCMRYELTETGALDVTFECIPRKLPYRNGYIGLFWASYIDRPESLDIHFIGRKDGETGAGWVQGVTPRHGEQAAHRSSQDRREFRHDPAFPLELPFGYSSLRYLEPWYYGVCRGMAFLQVFRPEDRVVLTQSPSGGGSGCPAWDFQWFIESPAEGRRYQLRFCADSFPVGADREATQALVRARAMRLRSEIDGTAAAAP